MYTHQFCPTHHVAYRVDLDPSCPQCAVQRMAPPIQLDYDADLAVPLDATGAPLDPRTLRPRAVP